MSQKLLPLLLLSLSFICFIDAGFSLAIPPPETSPPSPNTQLSAQALTADKSDTTVQINSLRLLSLSDISLSSKTKTKITIASLSVILLLILIKKCYNRKCRDQHMDTSKYELQINQIIMTPTPKKTEFIEQNIPVDKIEFDIDLIKTKYLKSTCSSVKSSPEDIIMENNLQRSNDDHQSFP